MDGTIYDGEWALGKRHGRGRFTWNKGTVLEESYEGQWDRDRRHGMGSYFYPNGAIFAGEWRR